MPRAKKTAIEVSDKRNGSPLGLPMPTREIPPVPIGLHAAGRAAWARYWQSPVSTVAIDVDHAAIERLCEAYDERASCARAFRASRIVEGSTGQPTLNPIAKRLDALTAEITGLEDRLGLTPMARAKLGVVFGEATRSLADLNAAFTDSTEGSDDDDHPAAEVYVLPS